MKRISKRLLSENVSKIGEQVRILEEEGTDLLHVDVMDGHFVPNISFGAPVMKSLVGKTNVPFDVHLMIENADRYIPDFVTPNTKIITVHQEACPHLHRTVQLIHSFGVLAGVALNPATPPEALSYILEDADLVLVMSVNPGFGGQKFIPSALRKIRVIRDMAARVKPDLMIEVDGGVTADNVRDVWKAGADTFVAGSAILGKDDIAAALRLFREKLE
jgi:ribulose-phosphate 3-epimerase